MNKTNKTNYNINANSMVEFPIKALNFILNKLKIRDLFKKYIVDPRTNPDYSLISLLMFCLCTHLFRVPSKNEFHQNFKRESSRKAIAKLCGFDAGRCPCPRTTDDLLLNLKSEQLLLILPAIFRYLCRQKVFQLHPEFIPQGEFAITIDAYATHTYHEHSQHPCKCCSYCLKRTRGDKVWYLHFDLVASFIAPNGLQIPLLFHRIRNLSEGWEQLSDDKWKQECERTALPLLLRELRRQFPRLRLCIHMDSLHATDSNLTLLKELKMGYSIVRKAKVLKTVGADCKGLKKIQTRFQEVMIKKEDRRFDIQQKICFFNDIEYRDHRLSIIQLEEHAEKKPSKRFAKMQSKQTHWEWIVHQTLTKENVGMVATGSRIRWKQEDLFNSLQCRGFAVHHDFNRAPTSQSVRLYLILIAYAISSILNYSTIGRALSSQRYTLTFIMKQMLNDLIYLADIVLTESHNPIQLRFGKDPP
jgi:hypothetical protein